MNDPLRLEISVPDGSDPSPAELRGYLEDDLRTRGEVLDTDDGCVAVLAYHRDEIESLADEMVEKLEKLGITGGSVAWTDESGQRHERA